MSSRVPRTATPATIHAIRRAKVLAHAHGVTIPSTVIEAAVETGSVSYETILRTAYNALARDCPSAARALRDYDWKLPGLGKKEKKAKKPKSKGKKEMISLEPEEPEEPEAEEEEKEEPEESPFARRTEQLLADFGDNDDEDLMAMLGGGN